MILLKLNTQTVNSNNSILINLVGTLYLVIRNLDFDFMIDCVFSGSRFFRVQVFQSPDSLGFMFFWVQLFQGPGLGSGSRF